MPEWMIPIMVFGLGAVSISLLVLLIGIAWQRALWIAIAGFLLVPFSLYLMGNPGGRWGFVLPIAVWAYAWWLNRENRSAAR